MKTTVKLMATMLALMLSMPIATYASTSTGFPLLASFGGGSILLLLGCIALLVAVAFYFAKSMKATDAQQDEDLMMDHEYDGIRELDNKLPPWWVYLFLVTIIFGVGYLLHYHVFETGDLQTVEYDKEMKTAIEIKVEKIASGEIVLIDENTVEVLTDSTSLEAGKKIFETNNCASCHGMLGEGLIGPNFTDEYWIHGGGIKNLFKTIKYGVPEKGMISWQTLLTPEEMQQVASYILTLQGTNPPNAKEPQGEKWMP